MKANFARIVFFIFTMATALPAHALDPQTETTLALDSSFGKPAWVALLEAPRFPGCELGMSFWCLDSSRGKFASVILSDGPPPRRKGPASRFDTHHFFYVYSDRGTGLNHFTPSGWMGDYGDLNVDDASLDDPADGKTCFKITYWARGSRGFQWAGMYWQHPPYNWGYKEGGFDLSHMTQLTFWARGAVGGEKITVFKVGGIRGPHPDSGSAQIGPVYLTKDWKQYVIDLRETDLSKVSGGYAWVTGRFDNAGPITFYLDEIRYER